MMNLKFGAIKKKRGNPESKVCIALWEWFQLKYPKYAKRYLRFEVKQSSKINQAILKAEGNKAGTSDIFLALPSDDFCGLWLEVKADKGRMSDNQHEFQDEMERDYYCRTGKGIDECMEIITEYMNLCLR